MSALLDLVNKKRKQLSNSQRHANLSSKNQHIVRLLPSWHGVGSDQAFWHDWGIHWVKSPGQAKASAVHMCMAKTFGKECPICEAIAAGSRSTADDIEINALKESGSSQRMLFNALMLSGDTPDEPVVLEVPGGVANMIFEIIGQWGDISHPETGRPIIINKTGTGLTTKYTVQPAAEVTQVPASIYENVVNLEEHVQQEDVAKLSAAVAAVNAITGVVGSSAPIMGAASATPAMAHAAPAALAAGGSPAGAVFDDGLAMNEAAPTPAVAPAAAQAPAAAMAAAPAAVTPVAAAPAAVAPAGDIDAQRADFRNSLLAGGDAA